MQIEYRAKPTGGAAQTRHVECRFAARAPAVGEPDLLGITTDRGPVSPATIYLLKRYYLETPDAPANDPGPGGGRD